jgi:hypothetical protein
MRAHVGGRVGVSARIPGPSSAVRGMEAAGDGIVGIISLPFLAITAIIAIVTFAIEVIGWLSKVLWWLLKALCLVLLAITAPIWGPIRGLRRRHNRKADRKAVARVRNMQERAA